LEFAGICRIIQAQEDDFAFSHALSPCVFFVAGVPGAVDSGREPSEEFFEGGASQVFPSVSDEGEVGSGIVASMVEGAPAESGGLSFSHPCHPTVSIGTGLYELFLGGVGFEVSLVLMGCHAMSNSPASFHLLRSMGGKRCE
jgi:hypothetical protein